MKYNVRILSLALSLLALSASAESGHSVPVEEGGMPTHADAAFIIAKFSGLFDRYVPEEASLSDCVAFLNDHGVYFGLLEVVSGKEFTRLDCARVMGQIRLVFSGEAEYLGGKVKLPKDIDSWETFCIMNEVRYAEAYEAIRVAVRVKDN